MRTNFRRDNEKMNCNHRFLRTLIFAAVGSYFAYALYWFIKTIPWTIEISLRPEYYSPATGFRFINSYSVYFTVTARSFKDNLVLVNALKKAFKAIDKSSFCSF